MPEVPRSSVHGTEFNYKHHVTTQMSFPLRKKAHSISYRWRKKCNPRTTTKDLVKMLEETGRQEFISTVQWVLLTWKAAQQGRSHCSKISILKSQTADFKSTMGEMPSGLMEQKLLLFFFYMFGSWRTQCQLWRTGVVALCCGAALLQEGLVHFTK